MRRLAEELGVGAMSLYHYVPNKEELIDGMVDVVFAEIELPSIGDGDWQAAMRRRALSTREALRRHRWAVGLMESPRHARGSRASGSTTPCSAACARPASRSRWRSTRTRSRTPTSTASPSRRRASRSMTPDEIPGVVEQQVQHVEASRHLGELAEQFPYIAEVVVGHVAKGGYDFGDEFEYGLDLILEALERRRLDS